MSLPLFDLIESFTFKGHIDWFDDVGYFSINDIKYVVSVNPASKNEEHTFAYFFNPIPKVGNVEFSAIIDVDTTQNTINQLGTSVFKVFAVVAQAVKHLINKYDYDILLCVAKRSASPDNFESRSNAYESITNRIAKNHNLQHRSNHICDF